jgi:hypothetical protein
MQGAAAKQHRFPVFNTVSHAALDFMNSMTQDRQLLALIAHFS